MPVTTFLDGRTYTQLKGAAFLLLREIGHTVDGTVVSDMGGGGTTIWTAGTVDIPCRIDLVGGEENLQEERISNRSSYLIIMPADIDVNPDDRFAIDGRGTFIITAHHSTAPANVGAVGRRLGGPLRTVEAADV